MKKFHQLCDPISDPCDPARFGSSVYVGLEHIDPGSFRLSRHGSPSEVQSSKNRFRRGDVLYGKLRPYLDKAVLAEYDGICSTDILIFRPKPDVCAGYLLGLIHSTDFLNRAVSTTNGVNHPRTSWASFSEFEWDVPEQPEQQKIAAVLWKAQRALELEARLVSTARELKQSGMHELFKRGLRGEQQKDTEAGKIPASWEPQRLGDCCDVVSSSLSYTDFLEISEPASGDSVPAMGIKVSDMNLPDNESRIVRANLQKLLPISLAEKKLVPPDTVVFPKRGAAIATNKKRMTTAWTVLDPNLIGVCAGEGVNPEFLFYWFQNFDLRTITEPGPTPQLNKKNLTPLLLPIPEDPDEQAEIVGILQTIDRKISVHELKRATLQELFKTLLHRLMTGQIRVDNLNIDTSEVAEC